MVTSPAASDITSNLASQDSATSAEPAGRRATIALLPGVAAACGVATVATFVGWIAPAVGAPVTAVTLGMLISATREPSAKMTKGISFASKGILQFSVVILGFGLSFREVVSTGLSSLPVLACSLGVALGGAALLGRVLKTNRSITTLIGVGTGICGASAIAATDAVIEADNVDVSYAIATIFVFNVAAVLTFPTLGRYLGLSPHAFGLWAGTAVNDMSSVVAASTVFGHGAGSTAVITKLTRTLTIVPISLALSIWQSRKANLPPADKNTTESHPLIPSRDPQTEPLLRRRSQIETLQRSVPKFVLWFVAAVAIGSTGLLPGGWNRSISQISTLMITIALAAIGLSARLGDIRRTGPKPLLLGGALWIMVAATSLGIQAASSSLH